MNEDPETELGTPSDGDQASPRSSASKPLGAAKKPKYTLPSDRVGFEKQIEAIRAFAAASDAEGGAVDTKIVGNVMQLSEYTVNYVLPFFTDTGILQRVTNGRYEVSVPVRDYIQAAEWGQDHAGRKLKPLFASMWFTKALLPRLRFREMTLTDAVHALSEACGASKAYKIHLERVIHFLDFAGLVKLDGATVYPVTDTEATEDAPPLPPPPAPTVVPEGDIIPDDAPFLFLDKGRKRKVTIIAPDHLTKTEVEKIKLWLELVLFVEDDQTPSKS